MKQTVDWQAVESLFSRAVRLPDNEVDSFLAGSGANPATVAEVIKLLQAHAEKPGYDTVVTVESTLNRLHSGVLETDLGRYRILEQLDNGGMGEVFIAERSDQEYQKKVVIKTLRLDKHSETTLQLFKRERQILAQLEHANIGRMLDGGTTPAGNPYVVMERIKGVPITAYCDQRKPLSVKARVRLVIKLCDAVEYAHQQLVVHGDLKPANVLVTDDGALKLLDFGIAALLAETGSGTGSGASRPHGLTPGYASPEQLRGEPVSTGTDIYSLGAILHELLLGFPPKPVGGEQTGRPTGANPEAGLKPDSTAVTRHVRLRGDLWDDLRGDLPAILSAALAEDRRRRYASVTAFKQDLCRYVDAQPVSVIAPTWSYQAKKFWQRNTLAASLAGILAAVLLTSLISTLVQIRQVNSQRDIAMQQQARAEAVSGFLVSAFDTANPMKSQGETITAKALLDASRHKLNAFLAAGQLDTAADLSFTMGEAYRGLAVFDAAKALVDQALAAAHAAQQPVDLVRLAKLTLLKARLLMDSESDPEQVEALLSGVLPEFDHRHPKSKPAEFNLWSDATLRLINALQDQGKWSEAEALTTDFYQQVSAIEDTSIIDPEIRLRLIGTLWGDGLYIEALTVAEQLSGELKLAGTQPLQLSKANEYLGLLTINSDTEGALSYFQRAHQTYSELLGPDHPFSVNSLDNLAEAYSLLHDYENSEIYYRKSLQGRQRIYPPDDERIAFAQYNFALMLTNGPGHYAEAEPLYKGAIDIGHKIYPSDHPILAGFYIELAEMYLAKGDLETAETTIRTSIDLMRSGDDYEPYHFAVAQIDLAWIMHRRGRTCEVAALVRSIDPEGTGWALENWETIYLQYLDGLKQAIAAECTDRLATTP